MDSALFREIHPEVAEWERTTKTNAILADIADILMQINANLISIGSGRPAKKPKPYPRIKTSDPENEQHFGSGALPPDELHRWIEEKRKRYAGSSTGDNNSHTGT